MNCADYKIWGIYLWYFYHSLLPPPVNGSLFWRKKKNNQPQNNKKNTHHQQKKPQNQKVTAAFSEQLLLAPGALSQMKPRKELYTRGKKPLYVKLYILISKKAPSQNTRYFPLYFFFLGTKLETLEILQKYAFLVIGTVQYHGKNLVFISVTSEKQRWWRALMIYLHTPSWKNLERNACTYKITHSYVAQKSKVIFVVKDFG